MQHFFPGPLPENARNLMRRLGYGEHIGREGQLSYTKRFGGGMYPRYHAYVEDKNGGVTIHLHLDQKQSSLGSRIHGGEYDSPLVEREMQRIKTWVEENKNLRPTVED